MPALDTQLKLKVLGGIVGTIAGVVALRWIAGRSDPHEWLYVGAGALVFGGIVVAGEAIAEMIGREARDTVAAIAMGITGSTMYKLSPFGLDFWPAALGSVMVVFAIFGVVAMISKGMR